MLSTGQGQSLKVGFSKQGDETLSAIAYKRTDLLAAEQLSAGQGNFIPRN
jgi:hypothetical protein